MAKQSIVIKPTWINNKNLEPTHTYLLIANKPRISVIIWKVDLLDGLLAVLGDHCPYLGGTKGIFNKCPFSPTNILRLVPKIFLML